MKKKTMTEEYFDTAKEFINKFGEKSILLWQCGGFYECYSLGEKGSDYNILEENKFQIESFRDICCMTVVAKGSQKLRNKQVFMAGFTTANPVLLEKHINELMKEGFTVKVVVENGDDIVNKCKKRKELGTFSPGTTFNKSNKEHTNNIMCVWLEIHEKTMLTKEPYILCGSSIIDILTGNSDFIEFKKEGRHLKETTTVFDELENFYAINNPKEIIIIHNFENEKNIGEIIQFCGFRPQKINIISIYNYHNKTQTEFEKQAFCFTKQNYQQEILSRFYKNAKNDYGLFLETTQLRNYPFSLQSFCFLLDYIYCHNPDLIHQIYEPKYDSNTEKLLLVSHALHQLNIIDTHVDTGPYSSVLKLLNKCITPMGKRSFNKKITNPTSNTNYLNNQYKITEHFIKHFDKFKYIREDFKNIKDTEKLYRKIVLQEALPCELAMFYKNVKSIHKLYQNLLKDKKIKTYLSKNTNDNFENICLEITSEFSNIINIDVASNINNKKYDINFINEGVFEDLDDKYKNYSDYTSKIDNIIKIIDEILFKYQNTGKHFVKLHTTEKSAPYLELTSARATNLTKQLKLYKQHYPFQTNFEGIDFTTIKFASGTGGSKKIWGPEFKKLYEQVFLSKGVFQDQLKFSYRSILKQLERFDNHFKIISKFIENIDFILNNAFVAKINNYCKPKIKKSDSAFFSAKELRHPLIEKINSETIYIPNDIELGKNTKGILLFGTNAVGKSCLIKSIGISVILAQSGMFVPCSKFTFYPYKKLFTRIIGNDNIFKGLSTFQVEMSEFKIIDEMADNNSLVLGDELCSGTEAGSAKSLFGAGLCGLDERKSSYIFATHFHELGKFGIIEECKYLKMKHMEVYHDNQKDKLVYNRKLQDGLGNNMYGLEVCKYLGFSKKFMDLAYRIRKEEFPEYDSITKKKSSKYNNKLKVKCQFCPKPAVDMHHLLPQKDADENGFIGTFHKDHKANTIPLCKKCHHKETINNTKRIAVKTSEGIEYHIV